MKNINYFGEALKKNSWKVLFGEKTLFSMQD
jgi:hypothetical protein